MSEPPTSPICLAVLNPQGRDPFLDYAGGPGAYRSEVHPPINFHAYAAATRGAFFDAPDQVIKESSRFDAVLVLIRRRVWITLKAVRKLKAAGLTVLVSWKECGPYQITEQLHSPRALEAYQEVLSLADGILSPTLAPPPRWGWITAAEFEKKLRFVPAPYPLEFPEWDFSIPPEQRRGLLLGTREFFAPTRNHLRALDRSAHLSQRIGCPVTVVNGDGRRGLKMLHQLEASFAEASLRIVERALPYDQYLKLLARHRVVFQLDRSAVPGQVAGDALVCRSICAGGNSTIGKIVFPDLSDDGSGSVDAIEATVHRYFEDDDAYAAAIAASQEKAMRSVSFSAVAAQLAEMVNQARSLSA